MGLLLVADSFTQPLGKVPILAQKKRLSRLVAHRDAALAYVARIYGRQTRQRVRL